MAAKDTNKKIDQVNNNVLQNGKKVESIKNVFYGVPQSKSVPRDANGIPDINAINPNAKKLKLREEQRYNFFASILAVLQNIQKDITKLLNRLQSYNEKLNQNKKKSKNGNEIVALEEEQLNNFKKYLSDTLTERIQTPFNKLLSSLNTLNSKLSSDNLTLNLSNKTISDLSQNINTNLTTSIKEIDFNPLIKEKIQNINLHSIFNEKISNTALDLNSIFTNKIAISPEQLNGVLSLQITNTLKNLDLNNIIGNNIQPITLDLNNKINDTTINESIDKLFKKILDSFPEKIEPNIKTLIDLNPYITEVFNNINNKIVDTLNFSDVAKAFQQKLNEIKVPTIPSTTDKGGSQSFIISTPPSSPDSLSEIISSINNLNKNLSKLNSLDENLLIISKSIEQISNINSPILKNEKEDKEERNNIGTTEKTEEEIDNKINSAIANYFNNPTANFYTNLKNTFDKSLLEKIKLIKPSNISVLPTYNKLKSFSIPITSPNLAKQLYSFKEQKRSTVTENVEIKDEKGNKNVLNTTTNTNSSPNILTINSPIKEEKTREIISDGIKYNLEENEEIKKIADAINKIGNNVQKLEHIENSLLLKLDLVPNVNVSVKPKVQIKEKDKTPIINKEISIASKIPDIENIIKNDIKIEPNTMLGNARTLKLKQTFSVTPTTDKLQKYISKGENYKIPENSISIFDGLKRNDNFKVSKNSNIALKTEKSPLIPDLNKKELGFEKLPFTPNINSNALESLFSVKNKQFEPSQPFTLENYLTSNGKYDSLLSLIKRLVGKKIGDLNDLLEEKNGFGGLNPEELSNLNLGKGFDGEGLKLIIGSLGGKEGGSPFNPQEFETAIKEGVSGLEDNSEVLDGILKGVGIGAGTKTAAGIGLAGTLELAAAVAVLLDGAYGAYKANEWDQLIGNTTHLSLAPKWLGGTYTDGFFANINHDLGEGFWARAKTAWKNGDVMALFGEGNLLENEYTRAEHKALQSLGKEYADELKRQRQDKELDRRIEIFNETNYHQDLLGKASNLSELAMNLLTDITGEENKDLSDILAAKNFTQGDLTTIASLASTEQDITDYQSHLNLENALQYGSDKYVLSAQGNMAENLLGIAKHIHNTILNYGIKEPNLEYPEHFPDALRLQRLLVKTKENSLGEEDPISKWNDDAIDNWISTLETLKDEILSNTLIRPIGAGGYRHARDRYFRADAEAESILNFLRLQNPKTRITKANVNKYLKNVVTQLDKSLILTLKKEKEIRKNRETIRAASNRAGAEMLKRLWKQKQAAQTDVKTPETEEPLEKEVAVEPAPQRLLTQDEINIGKFGRAEEPLGFILSTEGPFVSSIPVYPDSSPELFEKWKEQEKGKQRGYAPFRMTDKETELWVENQVKLQVLAWFRRYHPEVLPPEEKKEEPKGTVLDDDYNIFDNYDEELKGNPTLTLCLPPGSNFNPLVSQEAGRFIG